MIVRFDENLTSQEFYAHGNELAEVMGKDRGANGKRVYGWPENEGEFVAALDNPVLVTDNHRINMLHPYQRDTIMQLMRYPVVITEYAGTTFRFEQNKYPGVWGPNIDTLVFCRAMRKLDLSGIETLCEVGAGSGFITKDLIGRMPDLKEYALNDINRHVYPCWKENFGDDSRMVPLIGDARVALGEKSFDLIVCNPPYIPRESASGDNPYEGLGLLNHLINTLDDRLSEKGNFVTNFSSLMEDRMLKSMACYGQRANHLDHKDIPLKVCNVFNNKEWLSFLKERGLREDMRNGYPLWHTINIYDLPVSGGHYLKAIERSDD